MKITIDFDEQEIKDAVVERLSAIMLDESYKVYKTYQAKEIRGIIKDALNKYIFDDKDSLKSFAIQAAADKLVYGSRHMFTEELLDKIRKEV